MSATTSYSHVHGSSIRKTIDQKREIIDAIERDMATFYQRFDEEITAPISVINSLRECMYLKTALHSIQSPSLYTTDLGDDCIQEIQRKYQLMSGFIVAMIPPNCGWYYLIELDEYNEQCEVEEIFFVPIDLWQSVAQDVELPLDIEVRVQIHIQNVRRVVVYIEDLRFLCLSDLCKLKVAFDREWKEALAYAALTYSAFFTDPE